MSRTARGGGGYKALAAGVITSAVNDMRDIREGRSAGCYGEGEGRPKMRINATTWLASTRATRWFEDCGLDQAYALGKMGWADHAFELLTREDVVLNAKQTGVLSDGLDALNVGR